tara:strand:- start:396 stop:674 length:279 start_codon:yes stop_codon:yes gene_type:complete
MADTPLTDAVVALEPIENVAQLKNAFSIILGVPELESQQSDPDISGDAADGMQAAIDTLKDQAKAQAKAIRSYIDELREAGALSGDTTININ